VVLSYIQYDIVDEAPTSIHRRTQRLNLHLAPFDGAAVFNLPLAGFDRFPLEIFSEKDSTNPA